MNVFGRRLNSINLSYLLLSLFVFVYVLLRAIRLDITYDEAWTILDFIHLDYYHILNFTPPDTNNHILNSVSIKLLYSFLRETVFVARIPNLIALMFYLTYGSKLCKHFIKGWMGFALFLALTLNPFALDFFGLARGYGLVLGMQMGALYHMLRYFEEKKSRNLVWASLFCVFMILSNFSTLYFYLGWAGVFTFNLFIRREKFFQHAGIVFLFSVLIAAIIWEPIRKLIEVNGFTQGGVHGFFEDTLWSLVRYSLGSMEKSKGNLAACVCVCVVVFACLVAGLFGKRENKTNLHVTLGISGIAALATIIQHYLIGGLYLLDRTALFFYPLMTLILFFSIRSFDLKALSNKISFAISLLIALNFFLNANLHKSILWYFDSHASEIFDYINKQGEIKKRKQKVDFSWPFESNFLYQLRSGKYPCLENGRKSYSEISDSCDFYLYLGGGLDVIPYETEKQLTMLYPMRKDTVFAFLEEKVYLFRIRRD